MLKSYIFKITEESSSNEKVAEEWPGFEVSNDAESKEKIADYPKIEDENEECWATTAYESYITGRPIITPEEIRIIFSAAALNSQTGKTCFDASRTRWNHLKKATNQ